MTTATSAQAHALHRLLHAAMTSDRASISDVVTDDVVAWAPNLTIRSRTDLLAALHPHDEPFHEITLQIRALDHIGDKAIAEWHLAARHTRPLVIDDHVIAPTGRHLHLSGATIAEFDDDRICAFRSYYDDLALLEQTLTRG
jgi:ketosteroid isomerase-like protein